MSTIEIRRLRALTFLRTMSSGRTQPCLMVCADDHGIEYEVVVKLRASLDLRNIALTCEFLAALVADDLDLPVPDRFLIQVERGLHLSVPRPEIAALVEASVGWNFGSLRVPSGFGTWPPGKAIPTRLQLQAAEIFAFDILTQNPDRRQVNPNLLWRGEHLYLVDHEQTFLFLAGVIGWQPPWSGLQLESYRNHVFFHQLKGNPSLGPAWTRLQGALEALTDERLAAYSEVVPDVWKANNVATNRIIEYLREARENRERLFLAISHLLQ